MFVMDVPPDLPAQYAQVVIAEATQAKPTATEYDRMIGVCALVENPIQEYPQVGWGAANALGPIGATKNYLSILEKRRIDINSPINWSISKNPTHGVLEEHEGMLVYVPKPDYYGPDSATFLVETGDLKIKVEYFIQVLHGVPGGTEGYDPYQDPEFCPNGEYWRISFAPDDPTAPVYTIPYPGQRSGLFADAPKVTVTFSDLPGEAVGQSVGNTNTLDVDAAGHGWFVDETPWDNSEFLATSNPYEWVAKSGGEAAGQMDLLSVLLHEGVKGDGGIKI